jgi:nitrite reductase/ring-hydroxylating ferredoxin subunit
MDFPEPIKAIGEQIGGNNPVTPPPELFEAYEVFAAELMHLFVRPWLAVDHISRLAQVGDFFRVDVGPRSAVLVRESADQVHAMRNACLHAGYRVCEEEGGRADHLFCIYHGWSYALDGRLTDPLLRPELEDRSRYRLQRYAMHVAQGLVLLDMSNSGPEAPATQPPALTGLPGMLAESEVSGRQRYKTTWNWKHLRHFLWGAKEIAFGGEECDGALEFGPVSYLAWRGSETALVRLIPRYPGHSDFEVVRMAPPDAPIPAGLDAEIGEAVRAHGDAIATAPLAVLDRPFYDWYWATLSTPH